MLESRDGESLPRYFLGPTRLDGDDVEHASARFIEGQGGVVTLTVTRGGLRKLNELASDSFPRPPPQNQAALVLNGEVVSAPAFQTDTFDDRTAIALSGGFGRAEARRLARIINQS